MQRRSMLLLLKNAHIPLDLSSKEWDFSIQEERNAVREWISVHKPILVMGPNLG